MGRLTAYGMLASLWHEHVGNMFHLELCTMTGDDEE